MKAHWLRDLFVGTCTLLTLGASLSRVHAVYGAETPKPAQAAPDPHYFAENVAPVLEKNCYGCHSATKQKGGLRVDSRDALLKGGESGPAIVPSDPGKSLLVRAILYTGGDLQMPPKGRLPDEDIAHITKWIKDGAEWDAASAPSVAAAPPQGAPPALGQPALKNAAGEEFFENKVRPILATQCGTCHQARSAGGLSLTSREALLKGGDSGPAIVPGDPDKSLLITAVHQTSELKMPPKGPKLSDEDIASLAQWIKMGAPWPASAVAVRAEGKEITEDMRRFWSFVPLKAPAIPTNSPNAAWAKTDVDRLVLAKLDAKGLKPSPMADRRTLIRRATLDLIGLPPTEEEVKAFVADKDPKAYENLIDRLLASPRYGERWGRHWLDVARYADDDIRGLDPRGRGYMPLDGAYVYRDWVVKAMNADITYDKFVKMQLAGDLMSQKPTPDDLTATSFLGEAPWIWDQAEPVQGRADERNERIDAVSRGFIGLTVACARCHDHKYDPILAKDYYALGGVFASSTYKEYNLAHESQVNYWKDLFTKVDKMDEAVQLYNKTASDQLAKAYAAQTSNYMVAAWRVTGKPKMKVEEVAEKDRLDPEQLDRWVKFLAKKQSFYPYLHDWQMMIAQGGSEDQARALGDSFQALILDLEIEEKAIEDENDKIKAKADVPTRRKKEAKPNEFDTYDEFCPGCTLELKVMTSERANLYSDLFVRGLGGDEGRGDPGLFSYRGWALRRRLGDAEQQYLAQLETESKKMHKELPDQYPFVHGMSDKPKATDITLDVRGNPHAAGPVVQRAFLTVLSPADKKPYSQGSGRLELANDIVASPIASRVWVNRVWKWHFGTGIVNTADNFGKVGDPPSDPELLDYLAIQFQKDGMSLKKLQKTIMLSAVYMQSSKESPEAHEKDPENRLYSHFTLQRLDAEQLRDSVLFVAGDLDVSKMGGPAKELGLMNTRRTIYAKVSRYRIDPFLQAFDFPNPTFTAEQRFSTNVPVQRLYFMNNTFVYAQAGKFADRVFSKGDDAARIKAAYQILYQRDPTADELQLGLAFLKSTPEKPGYLVNQEPLTAWKQYARVLFSSNEFEFLN
ncbi:Cytochrome c, mono- and diheme variants [Granulicella rosea]|uniref:Cytochrome c, mono- and diheme variants n=1 Tax=Granulicella rosea TaxID=474952 RepID=A0A239M0N5_9BACT|nr:PSD1 and planctomycete cytochrome C domain-containing protein [Granulicella rosea]SNT35469.1 Cytochrome c, mono- and diheme variants [Granulicella rosea]